MRFSGSKSGNKTVDGMEGGLDATIPGLVVTPPSRDDRVGKFIVTTIGAGFITVTGLVLWILWVAKTGTFGPREITLSVLASLPFVIAAFVAKTKKLKHGQTLMTGVIVGVLTATGVLMPQWSQLTTMLLTLVPVFAINQISRFSVFGGALLAMVGIVSIQQVTNVTDPLQLAVTNGLHVIATMFSLLTKAKLQKLRSKIVAERQQLTQQTASSFDLITRHDADGLTLSASAAAKRMLGVEPDALLNLGLHDKVHVQDRVAMLKAISDAAATGLEQHCEIRVRSKTSAATSWKRVSIHCVPERDQTTGAVLVNTRIREVDSYKEQIERLQNVVEVARKGQERQRAFLNQLRSQVQEPVAKLTEKTAELDRADARMAFVNMSARQLQKSLDDLIDATELELGQYPVSITTFPIMNAIAEATKALQSDFAVAGIKVLSDVPRDIPEMQSDQAIVSRIFKNVLRSAADHAALLNSLTIKARRHGSSIRFDINCQGELANIDELTGQQTSKGLAAALGGSLEETRRSDQSIVITITLPVRARTDVPARNETKPQQHEQTSEGDSRARLSA